MYGYGSFFYPLSNGKFGKLLIRVKIGGYGINSTPRRRWGTNTGQIAEQEALLKDLNPASVQHVWNLILCSISLSNHFLWIYSYWFLTGIIPTQMMHPVSTYFKELNPLTASSKEQHNLRKIFFTRLNTVIKCQSNFLYAFQMPHNYII